MDIILSGGLNLARHLSTLAGGLNLAIYPCWLIGTDGAQPACFGINQIQLLTDSSAALIL